MYFNGKKQEVDVEADKLSASFATSQPFRVGRRSHGYAACTPRSAMSDCFNTRSAPSEVAAVLRGSLHRVLRTTKPDCSMDRQRSSSTHLLLAYWNDPRVAEAAKAEPAICSER